MVKLTQIDDESNSVHKEFPEKKTTAQAAASESEESDSDSDADDEDYDFDVENETIVDRIVALKDIIAPDQRAKIAGTADGIKSLISRTLNASGSLLWTLTSSALLLGVPLSLAILSETQLKEMENQLSLQPGAQDVLATGVEEKKEA